MGMTRRGFTLIEVLIALGIFSTAILGISQMTAVGYQQLHASDLRLTALQWSRGRMEMLRVGDGPPEGEAATTNGVHYVWETRPDSPESGLTTLEVTASWNIQGQSFRMSLLGMMSLQAVFPSSSS
jgi:prepilin-type N-terminal cleavage/methylation domain-containing protein